MAKHMLRVWPSAGFGPPPNVVLKCVNCPKYLQIERKTMEAMLTEKADHDAWDSDLLKKWKECGGFGDPYPKPSNQIPTENLRFGS